MYLDRRAEGRQDGRAPQANQMVVTALALPSAGGSVDVCGVSGVRFFTPRACVREGGAGRREEKAGDPRALRGPGAVV